jgi:hypothetical protein
MRMFYVCKKQKVFFLNLKVYILLFIKRNDFVSSMQSQFCRLQEENNVSLICRRNELIRRYVEGSSVWGESVANFYSPLESPEDSGDEVEEATLVTIPRKFKRKTPLNQLVSFCLIVHSRPKKENIIAFLYSGSCTLWSSSRLHYTNSKYVVLRKTSSPKEPCPPATSPLFAC